MLTKEEMDFTIKEMIGHAISLIENCKEYSDSVCILNQLSEVVKGNQDKAKEYWYDTLCVVIHDIPTYLSFVADEDLPIMIGIIETLYPPQ